MRLFGRLERVWLRLRQLARTANLALLRAFLRLLPAETHRVFALTLIVGALCGGAAVLFHLAIIAVETRVIDRAMTASHWVWLTVLTPTAGGLLSGAFILRCAGSTRKWDSASESCVCRERRPRTVC